MANDLLKLDTNVITPDVAMKLGSVTLKNKAEIADFLKGAEKYKGVVVTNEDDYKWGKKLRADLKKVIDGVNRNRIDVKNDMLKPVEQFEQEMKELENIVKDVHVDIDTSVKDYEENLKAEKQEKIDELIAEFAEGYAIEQSPKWLNKTKSLEEVKQEVLELVTRAKVEEERKEKSINSIEKAAEKQELTYEPYVALLETGMDVLDIIDQINDAGERRRKEAKEQEEYNAQLAEKQALEADIEQPKEEPELELEPDETGEIFRETLELHGTKTQLKALFAEIVRLGIKVYPFEGQTKEN